jgi:ABC-2 type transport system ATP-binding protein
MIELRNLTKKYGQTAAIDGISITIGESGIYSLLGRNGAGKTTLMKLIAGRIGCSGGEILVEGETVSPRHMPGAVNFVESGAEQFNLKVTDLINAASVVQDDFDMEFACRMMEKFELDGEKKFKQLSFGMKSMVSAILALSNTSKIILLDEPGLGFDAVMRDQFNIMLFESWEANPRLIIVSTHLIDEIAKITGHLIIIDRGKILLRAETAEIDERAYILSGPSVSVLPLLPGLNCLATTTAGSMTAAYIFDTRIEPPEGVAVDRLSLQDFFVKLVGGHHAQTHR